MRMVSRSWHSSCLKRATGRAARRPRIEAGTTVAARASLRSEGVALQVVGRVELVCMRSRSNGRMRKAVCRQTEISEPVRSAVCGSRRKFGMWPIRGRQTDALGVRMRIRDPRKRKESGTKPSSYPCKSIPVGRWVVPDKSLTVFLCATRSREEGERR